MDQQETRTEVNPTREQWRWATVAPRTAWLAIQIISHNLARWTTRIGLGESMATTKTIRLRFVSLTGRIIRKARWLTLHLPQDWPWQNQFSNALERLRALPLPS